MCHRPGIAFPQGSIAPSARAGSDPESRINRRVSGLYIRRSEGGRSGGGSRPGCGPAFVPERVETTRWPWQTRAHSGDKSGAKSERRSSRVASSGPVEVAFLAVCQETPTFAHVGDTNFCALMVLQGTAASGVSEGAGFGKRGVSARGAARRRERSDRSAAAPRAETSARAGRRVTTRVVPGIPRRPMHPSHPFPWVGRSSAAGTRRRSPSSFSR